MKFVTGPPSKVLPSSALLSLWPMRFGFQDAGGSGGGKVVTPTSVETVSEIPPPHVLSCARTLLPVIRPVSFLAVGNPP